MKIKIKTKFTNIEAELDDSNLVDKEHLLEKCYQIALKLDRSNFSKIKEFYELKESLCKIRDSQNITQSV